MRRRALPYTTQPPVPVREQRRFEQNVKEFTSQQFPELRKLCAKVKPEDYNYFDYMCEAVDALVGAVQKESKDLYSLYPTPGHHLTTALYNFQNMKEAKHDKFSWLGYYNADLRRSSEAMAKVKDRYFSDILEGITEVMKYFGAHEWDVNNPTVVPQYQEDFDEFFGQANWNPAPALAELEQFDVLADKLNKYIVETNAWYEYLSKAKKEEFHSKHEKIYPEGIEPLEVMWHVTTAYSKVMKEGFKTKRQLREEGAPPGGLGGGDDEIISFTASYEHAEGIQDGILDLVEMALTPSSARQIIDRFTEMGMSDKGVKDSVDGYSSTWGPIEDLDATMSFDRGRNLYERLQMEAQGEGLVYSPFFWGPDEEVYKNIDPKEVQIIEAVVDTTDEETTYHYAEEEWRIPVGNILSIGPVGSQEAVLEKMKAKHAASVLHQGAVYRRV